MFETNRIIRMDFGEPRGLSISKNAISYAAQYIIEGFNEYSSLKGEKFIINKIIEYISNKYSIKIKDEEILVTNGALYGIQLIFRYLKNREKKELFIPNPGFPPYQHLDDLERKVKISTYDSSNDKIMQKEILNIIKNKRNTIVIVASPNNPNGVMLNRNNLSEIKRNLHSSNILILDNSFENYSFEKSHGMIVGDNIYNIFSFSKTHALASYRIGYIHNKKSQNINKLAKIQWNECLGVSGISQRMATASMEDEVICQLNKKIIKDNIDKAISVLNTNNIKPEIPEGGFFLWIKLQRLKPVSLTKIAREMFGISIMDGRHFGSRGENYLRLNCAIKKEDLDEGILRFIGFYNYLQTEAII